MSLQSPLIDQRTAADITKQVTALLRSYAPEWQDFDPATEEPVGMSAALIGIFSRYCEIIIQRLNQAPEKNFLAFLDLLGASLQPPQPARVPLTFSLAPGSTEVAVVRAGTQVAALPAEGETDAVIFETERELVVTPAQVVSLFTRDPEHDRYADYSTITASSEPQGVDIFTGNAPIDHILYLGHNGILGLPEKNLTLTFTLASEVPDADPRVLKWESWSGSAWEEALPSVDETQNLTTSGAVTFENLAPVPVGVVNGKESRWLRCRLATPITIEAQARDGMVRSGELPVIDTIYLQASLDRKELRLEKAFTGALAVDLGKEFHPFGEKPKFGDTLYIANSEAFSRDQAEVTLTIALINPAGGIATTPPPTKASADLSLRWEFWNGSQWTELGVTDTTAKLTKYGTVVFTFPQKPSPLLINGVEDHWIRVRIITGNYGEEAKYVPDASQPGGYKFVPATFAPPVIDTIAIGYALWKEEGLETAVRYNDFIYDDVTDAANGSETPFAPFQATKDARPSLYFGLQLPAGRDAFPNRAISMFNSVLQYNYGQTAPSAPAAPADRLQLAWAYWNGTTWSALTVKDDSENFTRPGIVEFLPPADFSTCTDFGQMARFWLRVRWQSGEFPYDPKLCSVLLNTTMAAHNVTIKNEILGSSDESESQRFQTVRKPVLTGQQLQVRESEIPSADEQTLITDDEGDDAISIVDDAAGRPKEIWVRWHEVPDFYGSGPRDRHYVIDHLTGEIVFGNGQSGMIPPRGAGSVRMAVYQTGGGSAGNRPAGAITQMKTTVPYVEKVVNPEQASGGTDAETVDMLYGRSPRSIRHRSRSVTVEDYQDVAMLASPEVARALCVPLTNLSQDPMGDAIMPGEASLIIVPGTSSKKPLPSLELIDRVQGYLMEHAAATANISVVGPLYLRVDVAVEIALVSLEGSGEVEMEVRRTLEKFLHPLTGGLVGKGWDFGREPYKSDLYAQIESVPGVNHVRSLTLDDSAEDPDGAIKGTGRFLVYSGSHQISMLFE